MTQIETIIAEIERRRVKYKELISKSFGVEQEYFKGMAVVADEMMLFINSLPAEQPSEELMVVAQSYTEKGSQCQEEMDAFIAGAQWQKEQTINKACQWLNDNVVEYHPRKGELRPVVNINAFREAMEKEDEQ